MWCLEPDTYAFQVSPTDEDITVAIAKYAKASNIKKIGMLAATDTSGEVGVASANKIFPAEKIELKLARIDLRATDASTQLASVASDDVGLVYSSYTGGGAITVVKSFQNLGLKQPLIVSYGNISDSFVQLVKDVKPSRLLGSAAASIVPDTLKDPGERARSKAFIEAYTKKYSEPADMINVTGTGSDGCRRCHSAQDAESGRFSRSEEVARNQCRRERSQSKIFADHPCGR